MALVYTLALCPGAWAPDRVTHCATWHESTLASGEFLERHQVTAPKIKRGCLLAAAKSRAKSSQPAVQQGRARKGEAVILSLCV